MIITHLSEQLKNLIILLLFVFMVFLHHFHNTIFGYHIKAHQISLRNLGYILYAYLAISCLVLCLHPLVSFVIFVFVVCNFLDLHLLFW